MTRLAPKRAVRIALAAVLIAVLPAIAAAKPHDRRRADDCRHPEQTLPATYPAPVPPPLRTGWERQSRRDRELREVRRELRALEVKRADFHARWWGHERKIRRFERWYTQERAALEARWNELQYYAWR